jgi:putative hydrolase of the HAD superfamily
MNVVFDLGGVVVAWQPDRIVAEYTADETLRGLLRREIIDHADWLAMDRGTMTVDQAVERGMERTGLSDSIVRGLIDSVPPSLVANEATVSLMRRVKAAGNRLYCLSNMPLESMAYMEQRYNFWEVFDGAVISSRIGHCKPEPEIYEHLLSTYELDPADTVFIDDVAVNVDAARSHGIRGIQFIDVNQCERALRELGAL